METPVRLEVLGPTTARVDGLDLDQLLDAIRSITDDVVVSAPVAAATIPGRGDITDRELEMLRQVAEGLSNREIAQASFLSVNTVKSHIRQAYRKIGATSRVDAVTWWLRNRRPEERTEERREE